MIWKYIFNSRPLHPKLRSQNYVELAREVSKCLNMDWTLYPQMRYETSKVFAGVTLLGKTSAILINCVEPYSRLKSIDAHCERWLPNMSLEQSSAPLENALYDSVCVVAIAEDSVRKLKIGTRSPSCWWHPALPWARTHAVSSLVHIRADHSHQCKIPEFALTVNAWNNSRKWWRKNGSTALTTTMLLPSWNKFDRNFTKPASSSQTSLLSCRPHAIRTLVVMGLTKKRFTSQGDFGRFPKIAIAVIRNGHDAFLLRMQTRKFYECFNGKAKLCLKNIGNLFNNDDKIRILGNEALNEHLENLVGHYDDSNKPSKRNGQDRFGKVFLNTTEVIS